MTYRILIVEDEILVAMDVETILTDLGHEVIGIAADKRSALQLGASADLALVDVNLRDGRTGDAIGATLAHDFGVSVIFMTANPDQLGEGVNGTIGVLTKPCSDAVIGKAVDYAIRHRDNPGMMPPPEFKVFQRIHG